MDAEQRALVLLSEIMDYPLAMLNSLDQEERCVTKAEAVAAIARALAQPAPEGWRPIESAPRDGRRLILLLTPSRFPQVAFSDSWWRCGFSVECKPTHWHPIEELPAAPEPEGR